MPIEFIDELKQAGAQNGNVTESSSSQDVEEISSFIQEARKPEEGSEVGGHFVGGSMDLDEIDDADIDDIERSGDFVCAL